MLFLSHLKALLWKNWLLWRRKFIGSICELIFPLIVVGITVGIRSTSDTIVQEGGPFIDEGHLFTAPGDDNQFYQDLSALTENEPFLMETLGGNYWTVIGEDRAEVEAMKEALQPFVELFQTQSQRQLTFLDDMLTQDDLFDFVKNPSYGKDSEFDTLFFAVGLPTDPEDNPHEFTIFQPDEGPMLIPSMNWDRIFSIPDFDSYYLYSRNGFAGLQSFIANYILRKETGLEEASVDTYIALGYLPRFLQDNYLKEDGRASFPVFILLIFIIPLFRLVNSLTGEKSSRAREGMKIMGLNDTPYWVSWFIYYSGICLVISIISGLMLTFLIFENSSAFFIILWLFLYGMTFFSFGVLVASIMHKPINACIFVTLLHFIPYFIFIPIKEPEVSDGVRLGLSIIPTVAMAISSQTIFDLEQSIAGLTGSTLFSSVSKFPVGIAIVSFLINIFGQFLLGLYLDNVLPKQFGKRQHPCFMFKKSYWFGAPVAAESGTNQRLLDEEDPEQNNDSENFEVAPPNVRQLEKSGECMKVRNLRKVYGDGKVAIDDLSLTMYKDQIFALLGHNGAGKTTTFSILMGLYQPSGGSASVFNINMVDQSDQVRKNLGVCPQFDILFDTLTPEEHLRLYCMFKGVPSEEIDNQIEKTLKDVDLLSKRKSFAKNLSGGQKRKLSVGIAMIGGSKLILLDEPTSGMDLTARRKIWDMLKQNKKDRIILLTTHFMDEADILGDRIAIMTSGKVKCCGGSLFLKKKFGVGYNLVIAKETKLPNPDIEKFVFSRIENCIKLSEVSSEVTFQMPMTESHKFESFFTDLDNSLEDLKIKSYGVGVTTLEEVFLKVGYQKGEEIEEMEYSKHEEANSRLPATIEIFTYLFKLLS